MRIRSIAICTLLLAGLQPMAYQAVGYNPTPCDYPLSWNSDSDSCDTTLTDFEDFDDGFDKWIQLSFTPEYGEYDTCYTWNCNVAIWCEKKTLGVNLWVGPAQTSSAYNGSARVIFDKGASKNLPYTLFRTRQGVGLKNPKAFVQSLVKAKEGFVLKVNTFDRGQRQDVVLRYAKGDLLDYRSTFAQAGCKF